MSVKITRFEKIDETCCQQTKLFFHSSSASPPSINTTKYFKLKSDTKRSMQSPLSPSKQIGEASCVKNYFSLNLT